MSTAAPRERFRSVHATSTCAVAASGRRALKAIAKNVLPSTLVVWRGRGERGRSSRPGRVALTFDDGPTDLTTGYLDALARYDARSTFFVVGELCAQRPELVKKIAEAGHELAGHGYTHRRFPVLSTAEVEYELRRTAASLPAVRGRR